MKSIVLKVDVDTLRGTKVGVPQLAKCLLKHNAQATFLFSLGPDNTGRALKRIFRPGFFKKIQRTSVVSHYGVKTLLNGVLWPGPHIAEQAKTEMREIKTAGFEVGIHTYDHILWQDYVAKKNEKWTHNQMDLAAQSFKQVFGESAHTHGAAGWQMNNHAFVWENKFQYASDGRGQNPFYPRVNGQKMSCLQMPTTLPTLDEWLGSKGIDENNITDHLLKQTEVEKEFGHVYTLHAELEGMKLIEVFDKFLTGLKHQGYEFLNMRDYYKKLDAAKIPTNDVEYKEIPGRSGRLCCQGLK